MYALKRLIIKCDCVVLSHINLLIIFANVLTTTNRAILSLLFQYLWRALYIYLYIVKDFKVVFLYTTKMLPCWSAFNGVYMGFPSLNFSQI